MTEDTLLLSIAVVFPLPSLPFFSWDGWMASGPELLWRTLLARFQATAAHSLAFFSILLGTPAVLVRRAGVGGWCCLGLTDNVGTLRDRWPCRTRRITPEPGMAWHSTSPTSTLPSHKLVTETAASAGIAASTPKRASFSRPAQTSVSPDERGTQTQISTLCNSFAAALPLCFLRSISILSPAKTAGWYVSA